MPDKTPDEERRFSPKRKLRDWKAVRKWAVNRRRRHGWMVTRICYELGTSRAWFYKWWNRWIDSGKRWSSLADRPSTPLTVHLKKESARHLVASARKRFPTWGARKIRAFLGDTCSVSHQTVHTILVEEGLATPGPRKRRAWKRWSRKHGNSLWQIDLKQIGHRQDWLLNIIDDHSRMILTSRLYRHHPTTDDAIQTVQHTINLWGTPRQILTDRGTQFWTHNHTSRFTLALEKTGILHIKTKPYSPTTTGKIERWHRTLNQELLTKCPTTQEVQQHLPQFIETYNTLRPHEAIDDEVPLVRYLGSLIREDQLDASVNKVA